MRRSARNQFLIGCRVRPENILSLGTWLLVAPCLGDVFWNAGDAEVRKAVSSGLLLAVFASRCFSVLGLGSGVVAFGGQAGINGTLTAGAVLNLAVAGRGIGVKPFGGLSGVGGTAFFWCCTGRASDRTSRHDGTSKWAAAA